MNFRKHQLECINNIRNHFADESKGLIKMFCGSGKSYIIYDCLIKYAKELSVVVVPSINLITQFNKDYLLTSTIEFHHLTVCSKNELSKDLQFTTNEDDILEFLDNDSYKIILITYQSLHLLINVIIENEIEIDLICFDEAHHVISNNMKELLFEEDCSFIDTYCNKALFFTATPKNSNNIMMYEPVTVFDNYELINDDDSYIADEPDCGQMIYEYTHRDGVCDDILNDFNIRIDMYIDDSDNSIFEAISRTIIETGNNRIMTFHSRSEASSERGSTVKDFVNKKMFIKAFNKVLKDYAVENTYKKITFTGITATTKNKIKILEDFDNTQDDEIYILSSCKTIGEGVDTKKANMVVFTDPKESYVEIIQNIGRACRKQDKISTILLPIYVNVDKYKECKTIEEKNNVIKNEMSNTGDFSMIMNVLTALRQEDPYMFELCLNHSDYYTDEEFSRLNDVCEEENTIEEVFNENGVEYSVGDDWNILSDAVKKNIQVVDSKIDMDDIIINGNHKENLNYIKTKNNKYKKVNSDTIRKPNRNIKPKYHIHSEINILWDIVSNIDIDKKVFGAYIESKIFVSSDELWIKNLESVKKYIDENNKRPSITSATKHIKKMGLWLSINNSNYKKNIGKFKNYKIRLIWKQFLDNYKHFFLDYIEIWNKNLEQLITFLDTNKKRPHGSSKNKDEKIISSWYSTQSINYRKRIRTMKNIEIYNKWTLFINTYKHFFLDTIQIWDNHLNQLINFLNINKKRPSNSSKDINEKFIAQWYGCQVKKYNSRKEIMKNSYIYDKWKLFISEYNIYFKDNKTIWFEYFNQLINIIQDKNRLPLKSNIDEKFIYDWYYTQNKIYTKKIDIMKNEEIYKEWKKFIDKYSYLTVNNKEIWYNKLNEVKKYINENNKKPSSKDKNKEINKLGCWIVRNTKKYNSKSEIMKDPEIYNIWSRFLEEYTEYFENNISKWYATLDEVKKYINENNKKPLSSDKDEKIKVIGNWICHQQQNYLNKEHIMKDPEIYNTWSQFIKDYEQYFQQSPSKKSTTIKSSITQSTEPNKSLTKQITISEYQKLSRKISSQKSSTTAQMFTTDKTLWHQYHDYRDHSFKGYDNKDEIPINKIIKYLESKSKYKMKILDLGCGRNLIKEHFKNNKKFLIVGYDHVSFNNSIECDISSLPDEDESIKICIYSQSLMGSNWKDYINEGLRILEYNGEIIISESITRYQEIKDYIIELNIKILIDDYIETNRWFIIHGIKQ